MGISPAGSSGSRRRFDNVRDFLSRYIAFRKPSDAPAISLWVAHT